MTPPQKTRSERAQEALRINEERYALAVKAGKVGVWDWDLATNHIRLDPSIKHMLGYEDHEIRNHTDEWIKHVHPDDRERVMTEATRHLEGETAEYELEHRMLHRDGSIRWFLARGTALRDENGKPCRMVGTDTDITELKLCADATRDCVAKQEALLSAIPDLIFVLDQNGVFIDYKAEHAGDLLVPPSEFLGKSVHEVHLGELADLTMKHVRNALETGKIQLYEYDLEINHEQRHYECRMVTRAADEVLAIVRDITERKRYQDTLEKTLGEVRRLKNQLQADNIYLQDELMLSNHFAEIIGQSRALKQVLFKVEQVAQTDTTVLITGETGTGKEVVAGSIHSLGARKDRPLVKVNCAALPPTLLESELFGHMKGAFTGAVSRHAGRFEIANGATLFLDEIGDLPLELQSKLLRAIESGEFEPVGCSETMKVDVRIIAATNRNVREAVANNEFRADLYYRLNVFPIEIPPLRERQDDIPMLVRSIVDKYATRMAKHIDAIPQRALNLLLDYDWPGNIRELENVIERAVILTRGSTLHLDDMVEIARAGAAVSPKKTLEDVQRDHILRVLQDTRWKIEGKNGAAVSLGVNPGTLRSRLRKLGIKRPDGP